jgi:hypothetical protein
MKGEVAAGNCFAGFMRHYDALHDRRKGDKSQALHT